MRTMMAAVLLALAAACGPRQAEVRTAPEAARAPELAVHVTNNLSQAVNVYVVNDGTDLFLRQVPANTTMHLPVRGVAAGSTVTLRATTLDGSHTYTRPNVVLNGMFAWTLP